MGIILKTVWDAISELGSDQKTITKDLSNIQILVAGQYVTRDELTIITKALFDKLDKIYERLDTKADK